MAATSPWEPPPGSPAHHLHATEPAYRAMWTALNAASRADPSLPTASAIMAAIDLAFDLAVASGMIYASPDLIESLRSLADQMEKRRDSEPAAPLMPTLRELFASARPQELYPPCAN
jgi:hypothetical protein